jgi:dihydroorotase
MSHDLLIKNGILVLPWGLAEADIAVSRGRIAAIGKNLGDAAEIFDASNLHVLPGIVDPHVHFRDGGAGGIAGVEDMLSGTRGAILGGVTTVFDMPNTNPAGTSAAALTAKRAYVAGHAWCDVGLYAGATKQNADELGALEALPGICAVKVFAGSSTGDLLVEDDASIERVMRSGRRRIAFHSEDEYRLQARRAEFAGGGPYSLHAEWRDVDCAVIGTKRILALAHKTNRAAHILHVSTAEEFSLLRDHRPLASVEVLVNHLLQSAPDVYERLGPYAVMNPPLREARHAAAAWAAIADGTIDTIGSDHAPHSRAAKERPWPETAAGLTGVQTLLPLMLTQVAAGRLSLTRLVDVMSAGPARIYGAVGKGRLSPGYDADITIVDLDRRETITNEAMASPCGWTPFDGETCTGWPVATIVRGTVAMRDGEVRGAPAGRPVSFA